MNILYYTGLDVNKKVIAYCIKTIDGRLVDAGKIPTTRRSLDKWLKDLPGPWIGAMEATIVLIETQQYLKSRPNRFHFVFTPKHGSWLNLIESFLSKIARSFLRHIRVDSKQELVERIYQGIE